MFIGTNILLPKVLYLENQLAINLAQDISNEVQALDKNLLISKDAINNIKEKTNDIIDQLRNNETIERLSKLINDCKIIFVTLLLLFLFIDIFYQILLIETSRVFYWGFITLGFLLFLDFIIELSVPRLLSIEENHTLKIVVLGLITIIIAEVISNILRTSREEKKFCPKCNRINKKEFRHCYHCGKEFTDLKNSIISEEKLVNVNTNIIHTLECNSSIKYNPNSQVIFADNHQLKLGKFIPCKLCMKNTIIHVTNENFRIERNVQLITEKLRKWFKLQITVTQKEMENIILFVSIFKEIWGYFKSIIGALF